MLLATSQAFHELRVNRHRETARGIAGLKNGGFRADRVPESPCKWAAYKKGKTTYFRISGNVTHPMVPPATGVVISDGGSNVGVPSWSNHNIGLVIRC